MKLLKIYMLKLIAIFGGLIAGIFYLFNISMNIVATLLCVCGVIIYIDSKIHKENIYQTNINYMKENLNKKNNNKLKGENKSE